MTDMVSSYVVGQWFTSPDTGTALVNPSTGDPIARTSLLPLDYGAILDHARTVGGPSLRALTFQQRASLLKALGRVLSTHIPDFTQLSLLTGATRRDSALDVDGGIGVLFVYGSKGEKDLPDDHVLLDGDFEPLGKSGAFGVQHIATPVVGAAVQVNAFNFPVWGMLEKFAPAFLAGVPSVVKPASQTAYLTEAVVRVIIESGLLPEGSLQLACGRPDGLLDVLTGQDLLSVTGSRHTALALRRHPVVAGNAVRFTAEADSLNSSILGPDVDPGSPQFRVFVDAVVTEMTQKTGQKCTAIRRVFVPRSLLGEVESAVVERLSHVVVGDSADEAVRMGPVASAGQRAEVRKAVALLERASRRGFGDPAAEPANFASGSHFDNGAFLSPVLLVADDPSLEELHTIEAFGPVSTLLPYESLEQALHLVTKGEGSLVASLVTDDVDVARTAVFAMAAWHGRLLVVDSDNTRDSTGHGAAVPHAVHGGPGRAGGGEELAGLRSVHHYLQRTAVQGSPAFLASLGRL